MISLLFTITLVFAQNSSPALKQRVNLEDVAIQGEANKNRRLLQGRERFELDSRIKPRVNFRKEIRQDLQREATSSFLADPKTQ